MSFSLVGKVWDPVGFRQYVKTLDLDWAKGITMHHTWNPSLRNRPRGLTIQHIRNLQSYYQNDLGWSRGPHLFVDDDQIFGMSPLEERGIHAVSFNRTHLGIEVLGNYDAESPVSGRGKACWGTAKEAVEILLRKMERGTEAVNGHRDDPRTNKTCPGTKVDLDAFRASLNLEAPASEDREDDDPDIDEIVANIQWQLNKLKRR
jgi:hypothetical protein